MWEGVGVRDSWCGETNTDARLEGPQGGCAPVCAMEWHSADPFFVFLYRNVGASRTGNW